MTSKTTKFLKTALPFLGLFFSLNLSAQQSETAEFKNPPMNFEVLTGSRGVSFQMVIDKKIKSAPMIVFFSIIDFNSDWGNDQLGDLMVMGKATVDIVKGLKFGAGFQNTPGGIRPSAALIYTYANPEWLILAMPRIDLTKNATGEAFGLIEYRPKINEKWNIYSRVQGTYVHALADDFHARSYIRARAGLKHGDITFGLGANFEYYGPLKYNENNIGGFVQILLF